MVRAVISEAVDSDSLALSYCHSSVGLTSDQLGVVISGLKSVVRFIIKEKVIFSAVLSDLQKMNFPEHVVQTIVPCLKEKRLAIEGTISEGVGFVSLEKVRWRLDVIISTGSVARSMTPRVTLQVRSCGY